MGQDLPEALRMAAELDACPGISYRSHAAKLRRQHTGIERLTKERDALVRAMEIIAVSDAENPQAQAAEELIALGFWRDIPEAREITATQLVKRLTDEQINEIEDGFSNEFGLEAKHSADFARAIETECAAAWGVKLEVGE